MSYAVNEDGRFGPECAEVYGVPFSFIPTSGSSTTTKPQRAPTRVRALEDRRAAEIAFPRVQGYRQEMGDAPLRATWSEESRMTVTTADVPSITENAPIVGEIAIHDLDELRRQRPQTVEFELAKPVAEHFSGQPWRFPELRRIARSWIAECLTLGDHVFLQYLLFAQIRERAAEKIYRAIPPAGAGSVTLRPILAPYDTLGSTRWVEFDTTKAVWTTRAEKCHVSHVVLDSGWEAKMAQTLEAMPEVVAYVKNQRLGFSIPYTVDGDRRSYLPDYIVRIDDGSGPEDLLNLIVEVTGEKDTDKEAKVSTARDLWVSAVNNEGAFGRWSFFEVRDPWKCETEIRDFVLSLREGRDDGSARAAAGAVA